MSFWRLVLSYETYKNINRDNEWRWREKERKRERFLSGFCGGYCLGMEQKNGGTLKRRS